MKETGRILKEAREQQNITIPAVSSVTKINVKVLEAIENCNEAELPSKAFLRGFVQTYAQFLKLDTKEVMRIFHEEVGSTVYTPAQEGSEEQDTGIERDPANPQKVSQDESIAYANGGKTMLSRIIWGGLTVFLLICIYVVSQLVEKYQNESLVQEDVLSTTVATPIDIEQPPTLDSPETTEKEATDKSESTAATSSEKKVEKTVEKVEEKKSEAKTERATTATATTPAPPAPAPKPEPPAKTETSASSNQPHELIIEALDEVRVEYQADGGSNQTITLKANERRTLRAKNSISLSLSDGGAVNINHNGKDLGVPGNLGQPIKLSY